VLDSAYGYFSQIGTNIADPAPGSLSATLGAFDLQTDIFLGGRIDRNEDRHFHGRMSNVAIYSGDVTPAQVVAMFDAGHNRFFSGVTPITETLEASKDGYTTYQLKLVLGEDEVNCYTIFGDPHPDHHMIMPAAFQAAAPFGANMGGTNPAFWPIMADTQFDSWLTVGLTEGDTAGAISSIGVDWGAWTEEAGIEVDDGAVFWMSPDDAPRVREVVIAQLTLPSGVAEWSAVVNAQGRSTSGEGEDWDVYNMRFGMPLSLSEPSEASSGSHLLSG
jgi:hypothetical protein